MNRIVPILTCALIAVLGSCNAKSELSDYEFINPEGWDYRDVLTFDPQISDTAATGMLTLSIRHNNEYLYSNLYIEVSITDSIATRTDTLNMQLADDFGKWLGRGIGTDFQVTDTVSRQLTLRRGSRIKVRHVMRTDRLRDIERVGYSLILDETAR